MTQPLPAPVWLLYGLLVFTFMVHVLPMSVTLGGGFWAILATRRDELGDLASRLARTLPIWTAATVTTGVAALLFLQTLYGQQFYPSAIAIAWPWLLVVLLVIGGYYGYYFRSLRSPGRYAFWVGLVAWLLFVAVAFVYTNQMTLMLHPERIAVLHAVDTTGWSLNWGEPTLWARYLHMVVGAVALGALWVVWLGVRASSRATLRFGVHGFIAASVIEVATGLWFLMTLPKEQIKMMMGGDVALTTYLVLSVVLLLGGAWALWRAQKSDAPARKVVVGTVHIVGVVLLMVLIRDGVRRVTLAVDFHGMPTSPQWGAIVLFLVLLVAGLATLGWMAKLLLTRQQSTVD